MKLSKLFYLICTLCFYISAFSQKGKVNFQLTKLSEKTYMLEGQGGNIGLSVGEDGIFMIDSQFARLTPQILEIIKGISEKPIKYLVNTHHHGDHTGGNINIEALGTTIITQSNVKERLKSKNPNKGIPAITFSDKLNIEINNDLIIIFHVENAHTDGDALLYFTKNNILHTGDTYFNGRYPYIDLNSGGSVNGYINAVKSTMMLIDEHTKIIPGHGKLSNLNEYKFFLNMLETIKRNILKEIDLGKSENAIVANKSITKTYDDLGYGDHFISSEKMRRTFYKSLKNKNH